MKVLVTGGAGYIGSHTCKLLANLGHTVITYDNLSTGHRQLVKWGDFIYGDIRDEARLRYAVHKYQPDGLIHFASFISVGESCSDPGSYYENNILGSLRIMQVLRDEGVRPLVVSGSAAVYGLPDMVPVAETAALNPINPYGRTKLVMEWMLEDFAQAHKLPWLALRYFNAAGADPSAETGEWHEPETHLIPNVLTAILKGQKLKVFGTDYPTQDGTCIRDYIHVNDLAWAHVLGLSYLLENKPSMSINLGTGSGVSVKEIIRAVEELTDKKVPFLVMPRRPGDPASLVADPTKAHKILNWTPEFLNIKDIIATALNWLSLHQENLLHI
ncbi:MAG: UDP-glucose 4-epimerase GalE [Desulfovibrionaceae bacterium]|nr:UDP-glucose 4-epimerase GalE [Desulfovibrionaceae bacterium]